MTAGAHHHTAVQKSSFPSADRGMFPPEVPSWKYALARNFGGRGTHHLTASCLAYSCGFAVRASIPSPILATSASIRGWRAFLCDSASLAWKWHQPLSARFASRFPEKTAGEHDGVHQSLFLFNPSAARTGLNLAGVMCVSCTNACVCKAQNGSADLECNKAIGSQSSNPCRDSGPGRSKRCRCTVRGS